MAAPTALLWTICIDNSDEALAMVLCGANRMLRGSVGNGEVRASWSTILVGC